VSNPNTNTPCKTCNGKKCVRSIYGTREPITCPGCNGTGIQPTESFEDQLDSIAAEYGQLHEAQCDLNSEDGSDDGCTCAMSGLVSEVFAAHQATTDQRVADVLTRFADKVKSRALSLHELGYSYGDYSEVIELGYVIDELASFSKKEGEK